jgi:hypothetical protein
LGKAQNITPLLDNVRDSVTRIEDRPEVGIGRQFAIPNLRRVLWIGSPSASHFHRAVGLFRLRKYFMSAANRSCPAFLMASDRIDPGGNLFACARASDAQAAQS